MSKLEPQESTHRASEIAVDLALMMALQIDMLAPFISKKEMVHIQIQTLYVLIDIMGATHGSDPENVLEQAKGYFRSLKREKLSVINAKDV